MRLMGRWFRRCTARRLPGQSSVEVAAILVVLIPVIIGAVDLGRAYFAYDMLVHAVNEGARRGSFDSSSANVVASVQAAGGILSLATTDVIVTCYTGATTTVKSCASMSLGDSVRVTGNVVFTPITPLITAMLPGGTLTLAATAQRTFQ
jgi:hypothetical protein